MMDKQVPTEIAMRGMLDRPEQELILVVDEAMEARQRLGALLKGR